VTRILRLSLAAGFVASVLAGCGGPPAGAPNVDPTSAPDAAAAPPDEAALRAALAADPYEPAALSRLSKILWDEARHDEAVALLEAARAGAPRFPDELALALALHHDARGDVEEADAIAASLERRLDDWARGGSALTFLRLRGDSFAAAEAVARHALQARESASNHNNLGIALLYAGKPEEARESFLAARERDPALPGPLYNLAIVDRFYRFDEAAARDWFRRYRELSDEDPDGLAGLLDVKVAAGDSAARPEEVSR